MQNKQKQKIPVIYEVIIQNKWCYDTSEMGVTVQIPELIDEIRQTLIWKLNFSAEISIRLLIKNMVFS